MTTEITIRKKPPPPYDRGWAWMVAFGVFIYVFFMVGTAKAYGLLLLAFIREFEVSTAYAAMPMSLSAFVYAFAAPAALIVAEYFTQQKVVIFGAVVGLIGIALSSILVDMTYVAIMFGLSFAGVATDARYLMLGLLLDLWLVLDILCMVSSIGNSCFYGNGLVMIGMYFRKQRSFATGLALAGASIGQFAMPPLIEFLLETYKLGGTLLIIAALYFHCSISGMLFRPIDQYGPEEKKEEVEAVVLKSNDEETEVLMGPPKVHTDFVGEVTEAYEKDLDKNGTRNGDMHHRGTNGDVTGTEHLSYVSFQDADEKDTTDLMEGENQRESISKKRWSETTENLEDKEFLERKAMFASTGSIFLVSPSVLDVSDIDKSAHGLDNTMKGKKMSPLRRVFDFSVLRSYITLFYTTVCFMCFFGYFNFILFLPAMLLEKGITKYDKALLISCCGVGDLVSRISTGYFADLNLIARYKIKAVACLLCGINILVFIFADSFPWIAVHCVLYGFLGGAYVALLSVVLVDFVGLALMGRNLAVILLIQGIGAALGQIFLGGLSDLAKSFMIVILICGLSLIIGALLLFLYPIIQRWENSRLARISEKEKRIASMTA